MEKENHITLDYTPVLKTVDIRLPSSKSESNRALIINALSGNKSYLTNLSEARDTRTMIKLLQSQEQELDVIDAGTTMRFLIAYCAVKNLDKVLTGTKRMCERPVSILVEALQTLGVDLQYLGDQGYPPVHIKSFTSQKEKHLKIRGDVSSQYISALLMIAPLLPQGLNLELTGKIYSRPYIEMTLQLMRQFEVNYRLEKDVISIEPQDYQGITYEIESDWSGASYWYSMVALAKDANITLLGLRENSLQGDIRIAAIMEKLGVKSDFYGNKVELSKINPQNEIEINFTDCPDLAQTVAVICAVKGIKCTMSGLESLRIKETDRIQALQNELSKFGAALYEDNATWTLHPASSSISSFSSLYFKTYDDHRMAMAFAPIATQANIKIEDPDVVNKSYPSFWSHLQKAGFSINFD